MKLRGLLALALLVAAAFFERTAMFGARSVLSVHLHQTGESYASIGLKMTLLQVLTVLGTLVGGAVALGVGPRVTAVLALVAMTAGHFATAAGAPFAASAGVVSFGAGMLTPALFAAAAEVLAWDDESPAAPGPHRFAAVAAFAVAVLAASDLGSLLASPWAVRAQTSDGFASVCVVAGVLTLVAAVLAGGAALLALLDRRAARTAEGTGPYRAAPPPGPPPRPVTAALGGLAIVLGSEVLSSLGSSLAWPPISLYTSAVGSLTWLYMVGTVAALASSVFFFALLLAATLQQWPLPPLLLYGGALLAAALGLTVIAAAGSSSVALYVLGAAVRGLAEACTYAVPMAYAAIAVRGRAATLVVAVFTAVTVVVSTGSHALQSIEVLRTPLLVLCSLLSAAAGAAFLALGRRLHHAFFAPAAS